MNAAKRLSITMVVATLAVTGTACIENTAYVTPERSDKIEKYLLKKAPKVQHPLNVNLEGKVTLLGYDLKANDPKPGDTVEITWYWQVHKSIGAGWRLFTHGIGEDGEPALNVDKRGPVRTHFQPEHWRAGMIVKDTQSIKIPKDWKESHLELRTGIWKGSNRLKGKGPKVDEGNRVKGPRIKIMSKQKPPVNVPYADEAPKIDGTFEGEAAWKKALKLTRFVNTMSGQPVPIVTDAYIMWDAEHLYVAVKAKDDALKSPYTEHDDELWKADAFEIFLDPKGDKRDYYELQVNPQGVIFDSYLPKYRKNQNDWSSNMVVKTVMDGTLNDDSDTDVGWTAELAIPFASLTEGGGVPPKNGERWKINFFRVDAGKSDKKGYAAWSPPMRGDFHTLARFGQVIFTGQPADAKRSAPKTTPDDPAKIPDKGGAEPAAAPTAETKEKK